MRSHWTLAVLLSSALVVGCGDKNTDNSKEFDESAGTPGTTGLASDQPTAEPGTSPARDTSAARDNSAVRNNQTVTGSRVNRTAPPASADIDPAHGVQTSRPANSAAPAAPRLSEFREVTVPAGTALPLELMTPLSSETAQVETPVRAKLRQALVVDGYTALPAGTMLVGTVTDVDRAGRVQGRSRLAFRFDEAEVSGGREDLRTNPLTFEGEETKGEDATKIGGGAVGGAIIGGILGGGKGAAKGAVIGGAAGTGVVLATRGKEVTLAAGTTLAASLAEPFSVRVSTR
jgi:hypothetical protein